MAIGLRTLKVITSCKYNLLRETYKR